MDDIEILYTTAANTLEKGDQVILDNNLVVVRNVDTDREDIDEVFITGENLSDPTGPTEWPVYADEEIEVWSI